MNVFKANPNSSRVIFQETLRNTRENVKLVEASHLEAQRVIHAAISKAESIKKAAREEGLDEGKREAMQTILSANRYRTEQEMSVESQIIRLCIALLEKMVAIHQQDYTQWVIGRVAMGLRELRDQRIVRVRLNPRDLETYRIRLLEVASEESFGSSIHFSEDSSLSSGDCVFESNSGIINARITDCLAIIKEHLNNECLKLNERRNS